MKNFVYDFEIGTGKEPVDKREIKRKTAWIVIGFVLVLAIVVYVAALAVANSVKLLSRLLITPEASPWLTALREKKFFTAMAQFAPALFVCGAAVVLFPKMRSEDLALFPYVDTFQQTRVWLGRIGWAVCGLVFTRVSWCFTDAFYSIYGALEEIEDPIKGITRSAKRIIGIIGTVFVWSALIGKSPLFIVGGLGAFMAVIMLVFRDSLLGLVASIQIVSNRLVRIGDWIEMPKWNADGDVEAITLATVKVRNFDKTVTSIPTHAMLSGSFRNWSGMRAAGGRRIKRAIFIDIQSICVCTPEMVRRFEKIELLRGYLRQKRRDLDAYNTERDIASSAVNSRRLTNIGTLRAYLKAYLDEHPGLSRDMTSLVRHLQPTAQGLPVEIYAFTATTAWADYEAVQADIFDHVMAILPEFGLRAFQEMGDYRDMVEFDEPDDELSELEDLIVAQNKHLDEHPNARVDVAMRKVETLMNELGAETVDLIIEGRTMRLRYNDPE